MSRKTEASQTPAKRGRGRPKGGAKPRDPSAPARAPRSKAPKPPTAPIERKSWSRAEFRARHRIGSSNTYLAMLARGDGPEEMILGKGAHATRRISLEAEARWIAKREAVEITEEMREADREKRAAAHEANLKREAEETAR